MNAPEMAIASNTPRSRVQQRGYDERANVTAQLLNDRGRSSKRDGSQKREAKAERNVSLFRERVSARRPLASRSSHGYPSARAPAVAT